MFRSGNESRNEGETCQLGELMKQSNRKRRIIQGKCDTLHKCMILLGMLYIHSVLQSLASGGWADRKEVLQGELGRMVLTGREGGSTMEKVSFPMASY